MLLPHRRQSYNRNDNNRFPYGALPSPPSTLKQEAVRVVKVKKQPRAPVKRCDDARSMTHSERFDDVAFQFVRHWERCA